MSIVTMKSLLEAGVHFGHRTRRWHPKMRSFIFTERNGIHIIDLQQTMRQLEKGHNAVRDVARSGGLVLFVGTKRQAHNTILVETERCGMPYVTTRWLGGTLTNFRTIRLRVEYMEELERREARGELDRLPKKEALLLRNQLKRLHHRIGGLRTMNRLPDILFVVDIQREDLAVTEANKLAIPIVAMVDTNCDPDPITLPIPSNDDAIRAIKLMTTRIADAVVEGVELRTIDEADRAAASPEAYEVRDDQEAEIADQFQDAAPDDLLGPSTLAKLAEGLDQEPTEDRKVEEAGAAEESKAAEVAVESETVEESQAAEETAPVVEASTDSPDGVVENIEAED